MAPSPVWIITGTSSGFGLELALIVLKHGHRVIATARSKSKSSKAVEQIESAGGKVLELDVTSGSDTIKAFVRSAEKVYGSIDVLVNNAGYAIIGSVEDISDTEARQQLETNVFGPLTLIRETLPTMRSQKSGTIVNVSSTAGFDGQPGVALYSTTKFALEGLSEALARELVPFNISVLVIEPGPFRTNFQGAIVQPAVGISEAYKGGPVDQTTQRLQSIIGKQAGDPVRGSEVIFEAVQQKVKDGPAGGVLRVPLGGPCLQRMKEKIQRLQHDFEVGHEASKGADFPA